MSENPKIETNTGEDSGSTREPTASGPNTATPTLADWEQLAAIANKEMVNAADENFLAQGILFERRLFHGLFGTQDQKEGMSAFVEKRQADWKGE